MYLSDPKPVGVDEFGITLGIGTGLQPKVDLISFSC
jgi:hypothetical protein